MAEIYYTHGVIRTHKVAMVISIGANSIVTSKCRFDIKIARVGVSKFPACRISKYFIFDKPKKYIDQTRKETQKRKNANVTREENLRPGARLQSRQSRTDSPECESGSSKSLVVAK